MGPGTGGPATLIGREIAGYRLERVLGVGLTGAVYLGRSIAGNEERAANTDNPKKPGEVAIKILLPSWEISADEERKKDFLSRFNREARTLKRLQHPNLVSVLDSGEQDDLTYMVMPYLTGGTLGERMAVGELPFTEVAQWIKQLAAALDYAHGEGVIHRDIKPQNVMLDSEGNAHLADFSIVRLMDNARTKQTTEGRLLGTPAYMAPEQIRSGNVSAASDIYSLGVLCFAMVTGQTPFEGDSESITELLLKVIQDPPPRPRSLRSDLPEPAEAVIWQALAKQPEARFASASEMAHAFSDGLNGQWDSTVRPIAFAAPAFSTPGSLQWTNTIPPVTWSSQSPTQPRKRWNTAPVWLAVSAVLVLGLVGVLLANTVLGNVLRWGGGSRPSSQLNQGGSSSTLIYQNALTSPASEWEPDQNCFFASDGLHAKPNLACQSPVRGLANVDVSVQMRQISGAVTDMNGIEVRRSGNPASLYEFDIDATGEWLFKLCIRSFDNCHNLDAGNDSAIQTGLGAVNTVEVRAVGSHFTLLVNGTQVGQTDDSSLESGDVWLDTGGRSECVFTDFMASRPT
jgi:serine/threonine protein kinase